MSIYIGELIDDYSAMQGPCQNGFHVPLMSEWIGLKTIMDGLSLTTGNDYRINLHMPFAGYLNYYSTALKNQGSSGTYASSSAYNDTKNSSCLYIAIGGINFNYYTERSSGMSIRPFKDSFVTPTSGWTVITGTLGSAGIFWNSTDGIISITSDGSTGYTIADKNLGATTVYSDGDSTTDANCGNMYQWGNNYAFPYTGSVPTSSTAVNAGNYGPGNYYSSSTWINASPWDSSNNKDLRGGVTGVVTKPQEVKNIYIGEYEGEPITTAGIYWNETKGLISASGDGSTWFTIADKNLGASSVLGFGNYYQRGNNYGFSGTPTISNTLVDASNYGPGNYYESSTWIYPQSSPYDWSSVKNDNLWGNTTNTDEARQGPCPTGFHIPSANDAYLIRQIGGTFGFSKGNYVYDYFKIPKQGFYDYSHTSYYVNSFITFATTNVSGDRCMNYTFNPTLETPGGTYDYRANGFPIRPFKNESVQPTSGWTVVYQPS